MNDDDTQVLLVLSASPELEDELVDFLLGFHEGIGFTSTPVRGHSSQFSGLSLAEQVSGRQSRVQFQVHLRLADARDLLAEIKGNCAGCDLHYWLAPLIEAGTLG